MRVLGTVSAPARRLVAALAGAGLVAVAVPVGAAPRIDDDAAALVLLSDAAQAARSLTYSGTQYVATWGASTTSSLVEVEHEPGTGAHVRASTPADDQDGPVVVIPDGIAPQLLGVLRDRYVLRVAGEGRCTGRAAHVVEAHRPGDGGAAGTVAGRFWIDHETGLLLRREVFDAEGSRVRSSAFLDLAVEPPPVRPASVLRASGREDAGDPVGPRRMRELRDAGQEVPAGLPGGFALFDARSRVHGDGGDGVDGDDGADQREVLHLAYSDGLSTTSLFSQPGELGSAPPEGFHARTVAGQRVWAADGDPQRLVWAGGDRVWTLVSDAPDDAVVAAVAALPHDGAGSDGTGWRARLSRGAARLTGALNPFS